MLKKDIYVNRIESLLSYVNVYFRDHNIMLRGDAMRLNFDL